MKLKIFKIKKDPASVILTEEQAIIKAVREILPAVVSIIITKDLPKIKRFVMQPYGPFSFMVPEMGEGKEKVQIGGGSGFIVGKEGIVLTNRHVVSDPDADYTVITQGGRKFEAKILVRDQISDIAILKIHDHKNLPSAELGDSSKLALGQTAIAIGNALGLFHNTVSKGIVSGLLRHIQASEFTGQMEELRGIIQTDTAINPGNSGGPLVDSSGKVIGINTAVVFGAQNIGFAIPINKAKKDLEDLKKVGHLVQPFLGVRYLILNKEIAKENKLKSNFGALVIREPSLTGEQAVAKGSPAEKAGLKENDIILEYNGKKISEDHPLAEYIEQNNVGDEITLTVLRGKKEIKVKLKLQERK